MRQRIDVAPLGTGRVVYVRGTLYEQGRQLGQAAADLIRENVQAAHALVKRIAADLDLNAYQAMTRRNEAWVAREYPELLDELRGVAEGSGLDYLDLLHLNINTDVAYARAYARTLRSDATHALPSERRLRPRDGWAMECTQVLAMGAATIDGKTYIGKTRDLSQGPNRHVLLHREYDDGSFRNEFQIAGQLTLPVGVNSFGVSVTTSGQWSRRVVVDLAQADRAWHILNWQPVLRHARSVDDALRMIREQPRLAGMLAVVADTQRAVGVEVTGDAVYEFEPNDGLLVRTNHFLAPELRELAPTRAENRGTFDRFERASALAARCAGAHTVHTLMGILSDHATPPAESICRHAGDGSSGQTYAATVICPQEQTMWTTFGNPCESLHAASRPDD